MADDTLEAVCIAYPDTDHQIYVALLENRDNYCAKVTVPVVMTPTPALDLENIEIEDGDIYVFPYVEAG